MNDDEPQASTGNKGTSRKMETAVHSVAVKLPTCWRDNIALWFAQAECQFTNSRIKDDCTKYNIIVAALDAETLKCVSDIVINPPPSEKYASLKKSLIERLQDSEEKRLTRLLTGLQLDDRKPTGLLRHMIELAGPALAENAIVRTLWLQRLPQHVQAILSTLPGDNLFQLAAAADKILEVYQKTECDAVERDHHRQNDNNNQAYHARQQNVSTVLQKLQEQISTLTQELQQLKMQQYDGRGRSSNFYNVRSQSPRREWRHPSPSTSSRYDDRALRTRQRSRSRPRERSAGNQNNNNGYCYYHERYGTQAHKCQQPCTFTRNTAGNERGNLQ